MTPTPDRPSAGGHTPAWLGRVQDARIALRNSLIDLEGEAQHLADHAAKMESQRDALLAALEPFAAEPCEDYKSGLVTCLTDVLIGAPPDATPCRTCRARAAIALARGEG